MPKTTDFTNFANERPNYFPGQFLLEDDFELQHKYLSDRQSYHNQSLHISGILEGLEVIADKKAVLIKSGSAVNSKGELIVVKIDTPFSDFKNLTNGELYIQYSSAQNPKTQQQTDIPDSYTRWIENPVIGFGTTPENSVKLAKLTIADSGITVDNSIREYSGLSLPNPNSKALTLRSGGNANPNLAVLTGSLKLDADITIQGKIQPSAGNSENNGIMFPKDSFGGSGDAAWIRYYSRNPNSTDLTLKEQTTLEIGTSNDPQDHIALITAGGVGIGTTNPGDYKLNVQGNQLIKGSLTIQDGNVQLEPTSLVRVNYPDFTPNNQRLITFDTNYQKDSKRGRVNFFAPSNYYDNVPALTLLGNYGAGGKVGIMTTTPQADLDVNGNVSIGTTSSPLPPVAKLDITSTTRTGTHPSAVKGLYVTGDFAPDSDGIEFRHTNGTQGIGFGYNTIYATGSNVDQDLGLKAKGAGKVIISSSLRLAGTIYVGGNPVVYENYEIYLRGSAFESTEGNNTFLKIANIDMGMSTSRGLNTVILNPNGTYKNKINHDVWANNLLWNDWATWVNTNAAIGDIVAVATFDAVNSVPSGGSAETLLRSVNARRAFQGLQSRIPYTLLFIQGQSRCIEVSRPYQGSNAHLKTTYYQLFNTTLQEPWQTPTFQNNWVNYENTYNPAGYFKDDLGIVHLRGLVKNGTNNTTIFTLPAGYRPLNRELLTVQTYTTAATTLNNTTGRVDIQSDGQVVVMFGNNGWLSLDGLTFRAA